MSRYIDADALIRDLQERYCRPCKSSGLDYNGVKCKSCQFDDEIDDIDGFADNSIDIEPKRGKWIQTSNDWIAGTCGAMFYPYHCSSCGYETYDDYDGLYNFCPKCGARMKGATDGNK